MDWLVSGREAMLQVAKNYLDIFNEETTDSEGKTVKKYAFWGMEKAIVTELGLKFARAQDALAKAMSAETRTPVVNQEVKTAFDELEAMLRMIKRRFGHRPPMTDADFVALGWTIPDRTATAVGVSQTVPVGLVSYRLPHMVRMQIIPLDASFFDRKTAALVCVRWGILDPDKEGRVYIKKIPVGADDLPEQEDRRRKDEDWKFNAADAGKKVYFCMRYVNAKGESGNWGSIIEAVIT